MKTTATTWLACAIALGICLPAAAQKAASTEKKLYCWDEGGRRVCGDALPPDAINRARTEINARSGMRSGEVARTLTPEEQAAAAVTARQAASDAEAEAARKRRDLAMAESYATEADLRRAYGERITLVEESLKTSRLGVLNLRQSLLSLLRQAAELELQSKPVYKSLADNISNQHTDLLRQQVILQQQLHDHASLGSDLDEALVRYRALKTPKSTAG
jgi:hypothetical protein